MERGVLADGRARSLGRALGLLSLASGLLLVARPRPLLELYGLPVRDAFGRAIGVRDCAIGLLLLRPSSRRLGYAARAASDFLDLALIAGEARRRHERGGLSAFRLAVALASATLSAKLASAAGPRQVGLTGV